VASLEISSLSAIFKATEWTVSLVMPYGKALGQVFWKGVEPPAYKRSPFGAKYFVAR